MSDTGKLATGESRLWEGVDRFATMPGWLVAGRDEALVHAALAAAVPEFVSGGWTLHGVETGHIRYKEGRWPGRYDLIVTRPGAGAAAGAGEPETLTLISEMYPPGVILPGPARVEGALGEAGWQAVLPDLNLTLRTPEVDTVLPALAVLSDPEESRRFLGDSIRRRPAYRDLEIQACRPNIVRYKPGSRCTIVYQLEYPPGLAGRGWPEVVVAKTYKGEKGNNAYESMEALWQSPLGASRTVAIAEPLAYDPEMRVLVQGPIREEITLKKFYMAVLQDDLPGSERWAELEAYLRKTARGLAEMHLSGVAIGQPWRWEDERDEVRQRMDALGETVPALAEAVEPLLGRLEQLSAQAPPDLLAPSHGSFRPAQVLLYQGQIGFIDFDTFCQAEPAHDLALFLSLLVSLGLTGVEHDEAARSARYERICALSECFLAEYEKLSPVSRQRVALWETLDILHLILHGWTKIKVDELAGSVYLLERFLLENRIAGER